MIAALMLSNPVLAENDLPPVGHSRFDELIGKTSVPFPFPRLMKKINAQMQAGQGSLSPLKVTLIPLGRSLQREAGAPDFFRYPRVVAAADGDNKPGYAPLKDRLFLGFHEKGEVVEVISYNDAAGRFEFQIVRDYAPGKTPRIFYARRSLCLACHQNAAPMFARPLWDETSANPAIAARLKTERRNFYQLKITGTDIAYFIDNATDRANLFGVWQTLWRQACGAGKAGSRCRMQAFSAALDYARFGKLPAPNALPALRRDWKKNWPHGLAIPNADLPNRDPLAALQDPASDPLLLRPPLETWNTPDITAFVVGLAGMLDSVSVRKLGSLDPRAGLESMLARGTFDTPVFSLALADALLDELRLGKTRHAGALPAPRAEPRPGDSGALAIFRSHCGVCHDSAGTEPPNFLHGGDAEVNARLDHCAERIFYRLNMGRTAESGRRKSPMPPPAMLAAKGLSADTWARSSQLEALIGDISQRIKRQGGRAGSVLERPFDQLRACLPASPDNRTRHATSF